jgi:SAM-dependent methyltransferase
VLNEDFVISRTHSRPYKYLAEFYDRMFADYANIADAARRAIIGPILPQVYSACDLACGPGTTAVKLARGGIRTTAIDLSPSMCRLVRGKALHTGVVIRVLRADMRDFRLPESVDLVTCEGDAINHVESKSDLAAVAGCAAHALRPGGWFYFDVNNRAGFKSYWTGTWWNEKPGVVMVMRNGNDARNDRAWCEVEWFIRDRRGNWQRRHEIVREVCWSAKEIRSVLKTAGFDKVRAWDAAPFFKSPVVKPGCRTLYLARKASP